MRSGSVTPSAPSTGYCAASWRPFSGGLLRELRQARTGTNDGLIPLRPGGNTTDLDAQAGLQKRQVVPGARGKLLVRGNAQGRRVPSRHALVDRLDALDGAHGRRYVVDFLAPDPVGDANGDLVELVQHVELGHNDAVEAVDRRGVAQQRKVEPAAP